MTLYEIIKNILDITKIALVNSNFIGDIYELNHRLDIQYPACVITLGTHQTDIQNDTDIYNLNIFLVDRLLEDKSNELDVLDWAKENLSAIIDAIQLANIGYLYGTSEINTFTEKFDSLCAGAFANIKILVEKCCCREVKIVTSVNGQTGDIFIQGIDGKYVKTVNGKDGNVTLKTSDIENNSGYITKDETVDIDIFNEFVNNLNVINENLNTAIEGLENTKADKTELGNYNRTDNFKTINNESIIGTGNINIEVDIPTKLSEFINDVPYATETELGNYNRTDNFKTINNESIIGTGNINIKVDNPIVYLYYDGQNFTDAEGNILTNNDVIQKAKDNTSFVVLNYNNTDLLTISTIYNDKIKFCGTGIDYIMDGSSERVTYVVFIEVSTDNVEFGVVDCLTPAFAEELGFLTDATLPEKLQYINISALINDVPYATVLSVDRQVNVLQVNKAGKTELAETEIRLTEKINEILLYKIPNLTIFGEPTIQNGQISNFSTSNYALFPFLVDFKDRAFEIKICLTTGNLLNVQENILDSLNGLALAIRNGHFVIAMSSDGQTWDMGEHIGNINLQTNTTYYINFSWNNLVYKLEVSTDKESYTTDITVSNTKSLYAKQIIIGKSLDNSYVFSGSINLNYCSLSIMNQYVWQGMDDAGLATRLATDMSNIDSIGIEKVKEIVSTDFATKVYVDNIVGNISDVLDIILGDNNNNLA